MLCQVHSMDMMSNGIIRSLPAAGGLSTGFCGTPTDGWHNVTAVYCGTGVRVYINGEIVAQGVTSVFFEEFGLISGDVKRIGNNKA